MTRRTSLIVCVRASSETAILFQTSGQDFIFADDAVRIFGEVAEKGEGPRAHRNDRAVSFEHRPSAIEPDVCELYDAVVIDHVTPNNEL